VLAEPGRPTALADVPIDPPVGIDRLARRTTVVPLAHGAVLAGYTDGLVERRHRIIDEGIGELVAAIQPAGAAEHVCDEVMAAVATTTPVDDIALLVLRRAAI